MDGENVGGNLARPATIRFVIGAFPWKFIGSEASICRSVAFDGLTRRTGGRRSGGDSMLHSLLQASAPIVPLFSRREEALDAAHQS